jgi:lysophospholipase L1-like esterase
MRARRVNEFQGSKPSDRAGRAKQASRDQLDTEHGSSVRDWLGPIVFLPPSPKPMAHRNPHAAEALRHAPRAERQPAPPSLLARFWPGAAAGKLSGESRRREALAVIMLVAVAMVISVSGPMARAGAAPPASDQIVDVSADQTENPSADPIDAMQPTPEPTADPTDSPTQGPAATRRPAPTKKPAPKPITVRTFVALGDSLTAWPATNPWPSRLDAQDPYLRLVKNAGVPGNTTGQMRSRFTSDVLHYHPGVVFVLGGTNDLGFGVSPSTTIANLRAIVLAAKANHIIPILVLVPPDSYTNMASRIDYLNNLIINLANSQRVVYVDIHTPLSNTSGTYQSRYTVDGLHFSNLGAQLVANTIRTRIRRMGL